MTSRTTAISRGTLRFAARYPRPSQISLPAIPSRPYHPSLRFKKIGVGHGTQVQTGRVQVDGVSVEGHSYAA